MEKIIVRKPTREEIKQAEAWGTWEKEQSEFPWSYSEKETCYILEGKAEVIGKDGARASFGKGDWVEFPKGLQCTWRIKEKIKKKYRFG